MEPYFSPVPPPPRRVRPAFLLLLLLALLGSSVLMLRPDLVPSPAVLSAPPPSPVATDRPPVPSGLSPVPLGSPAPVPVEVGTLRFAAFQDDGTEPVAYDPCRPVSYVVRPDGAFPGADTLLANGFSELSYRTGLHFVSAGPTSEGPSPDRPDYQPDRYGPQWAPVLVVWSSPEEYPGLEGPTTGLAGSTSVGTGEPGSRRYVTGQVVFDAPQLAGLDPAQQRAVVLHELAHLVGLDHVDDQRELLYSRLLPGLVEFGPGDRHGLARLGLGACFADL